MDARGIVPRDRQDEPQAGDLSNAPATTSLVLGLSAFVIQLLPGLVWVIQERASDEAMRRLLAGKVASVQSSGPGGIVVSSLLSLAVGISAMVFGVKGRRLTQAEVQGRTAATIGLVLGIVCVAVPISGLLAFLAWVSCCVDTL